VIAESEHLNVVHFAQSDIDWQLMVSDTSSQGLGSIRKDEHIQLALLFVRHIRYGRVGRKKACCRSVGIAYVVRGQEIAREIQQAKMSPVAGMENSCPNISRLFAVEAGSGLVLK